ncbi:MAG: succinate CoA transferase [Tissierellia bacterium]|nr:succinate CoA transferase [Tissierellia bacterium]
MQRIKNRHAAGRRMPAEDAALLIKDGMNVITSGFTPSGYPKAVPLALARRVESGEKLKINLFTGASVGDELDGSLSRVGAVARRFPYQTNADMRKSIHQGKVCFSDIHLSHFPKQVESGVYGDIDIAIVEALAILEDGSIVPTTSVGISPTALQMAKQVIVEINTSQPLSLCGIHDIYLPKRPPFSGEIPIYRVSDRIGSTSMACDPNKIVAVVMTDIEDSAHKFGQTDPMSVKISEHLIRFFEEEVERGRLPDNLFPLQSGVGNVSNAVLSGLVQSGFKEMSVYSEVLQDSVFELIESGKVTYASGTALTPSKEKRKWLFEHLEELRRHCILRPMEISNHPEVIRRLGVIAMNTALEIDIYGHVNSTHLFGSRLLNGIGGSGDFARNSYISIFTTSSIALEGKVSSIVPKVSHTDHTEHDVHIVVTEQGLADLRALAPVERAEAIIENCAHPMYRSRLREYLHRAMKQPSHEPHLLEEALSWHVRYLKEGSM